MAPTLYSGDLVLLCLTQSLRRLLSGALLLVLLLLAMTSTALERPIDPKLRSAARELGAEGMALFRKGSYAEALDKFNRANKLMHAPTLGVRAARCLAKLGRLVEAAERYLEVTRFKLAPGAAPQYRRAVRDARRERDEILPRIGKLEFLLVGPLGKGVEVRLDGVAVPKELIGARQPIDPGEHEVRVTRGDVQLTRGVQVGEGERTSVTLKLPALAAVPADSGPSDAWHTATVSAFAVAAAGLLAGAVNGGVALQLHSDLESRCPNRDCPPEEHATADVFDATRVATTVGLVMAGAGGLTGGLLLLLRPDQPPPVDESTANDQAGRARLHAAATWTLAPGTDLFRVRVVF